MKLSISTDSLSDYRKFLRVRRLPVYAVSGSQCEFPDEYAHLVGGGESSNSIDTEYVPSPFLFDYQRDITRLAVRKQRFAVFAECGLGKTLILLEYSRHVASVLPPDRSVLIVSPLMVVGQTLEECRAFYGDSLPIQQVSSRDLPQWLESGTGIGITNYEALTQDLPTVTRLGGIVADEASMLKSHYGKWGQKIIDLGAGVKWKLSLTGTPAPNDRIEYANQAVFLDACKTVNEFLANYFVNRGQTDNRWELKPHALEAFYRDISHWCIFLTNPAVYGWKDNCASIPPIHVHIDRVDMTAAQQKAIQSATGGLFVGDIGGIGQRSKLGQIAKGSHAGEQIDTLKPAFIRRLVDSWPDESTLIWCLYNEEQDIIARTFPEAANISGDTPHEERMTLIEQFKRGERRILISKPKILGFGLNLQRATRQVFSGLQDSYESYWQAVKRSNRVGSTRPLNVHIPITDVEEPMVQNVLRKASMIQHDTEEQERIFKENAWNFNSGEAR